MEKLKNEVWTWTGTVGNEAATNRDHINAQKECGHRHSRHWTLDATLTASPATPGTILDCHLVVLLQCQGLNQYHLTGRSHVQILQTKELGKGLFGCIGGSLCVHAPNRKCGELALMRNEPPREYQK